MGGSRGSDAAARDGSRGTLREMQLRHADYVILVVEDLERSLAFWEGTLGLPLAHRAAGYAQFDTGTTRIALITRAGMADALGRDLAPHDRNTTGFEIGFKVDDVDAAFAELVDGGAEAAVPPTDRPWGQRTAYVRDPDGHWVELAEQTSDPIRYDREASGGGP